MYAPADRLHRGGRLGRLAAHRGRDPQRVHGRLQGDVVEARRLPRPTSTSPALDPRFARRRRREDVAHESSPLGERAGGLLRRGAPAGRASVPGTPVAVANVDAHVSVPGGGRDRARARMVAIMGTSICHILLGDRLGHWSKGCAASSRTASSRAVRLRGGPVGRGRHLRLVRRARPCRPRSTRSPERRVEPCTRCSSARRRACAPGRAGLLALDWWNGNRSVLVDADLSGLLVGMTLATTAGRDLPRPDRGDRVRHAGDRRAFEAAGRARSTRSSPAAACPSGTSC